MWWTSVSEVQDPPALLSALYVPLAIAVLALRKTYRRKLNRRFLDEIGPVLAGQALAAMLLLSLMILLDVPGQLGRSVAKLWICAAVLVLLCRAVRAVVQRRLRRHNHLVSPVLIVGNGRVAHRIIERLQSSPELGLSVVGLLDAEPPWFGSEAEDKAPSSPISVLRAPSTGPSGRPVPKASSSPSPVRRTSCSPRSSASPTPTDCGCGSSRGCSTPWASTSASTTSAACRCSPCPTPIPRGWQFTLVKHFGDRLVAAVGLLLISPIFLALMVLVRLSSPGPIMFRQPRVGRDGQVFDCLKFRSMRPPRASDADFQLVDGQAPGGVEGVDRRTAIGKIMRRTSLDELPQLLNVIKGDMSLVGPRPERPEFVELFEAQILRYGERHRVKAGVTGWAQVHGLRGQTSIADRAEWDNYYIENWSVALDIKILALTVLAVVHRAE